MIEKAKTLLGIKNDDKNDVLALIIETASHEVENYCNIDSIPAKLENIVVRMAVDLYRSEGYGQEAAPQAAKSVSRGDVSITYGDGKATAEITGGKSVLDDYKAQLQAFRKLRW